MARNRLVSVDVLRGVAVLAVLVNHLPFSTSLNPGDAAPNWFPDWLVTTLGFGHFGVQLFLVISGFCIHLQWARAPERPTPFVAFWKRRLHRLYPPFLFAVVLSFAGLFVLYGIVGHRLSAGIPASFGYGSTRQLVVDVVLLLLLAQNLNGAYLRVGNPPFWSLALEEQLYALYFPLQAMRRRWGWLRTLGAVAATTVLWRAAGAAMHEPPGCWYVVGPALWLEWTLGAVAVEAYLGRVTLPRAATSLPVALLLTAAAVVANCPSVHLPAAAAVACGSLFGLAFFVWLNVLVAAESRMTGLVARALARVGVWSYSLYLTHVPVMVAVKQLARFGVGVPAIAVARLAVPLVVGYVFHRLVERRFMNTRSGAAVESASVAAYRSAS